jgi:hypothetical protein
MFKKTLVAASIAAITSTSALAGTIVAGVTESGDRTTTIDGTTLCSAAATSLGVTLDLGGFTLDPTALVSAAPTQTASNGLYAATPDTVVLQSATTCVVTFNKDIILTASDVASSLEGAQANGTKAAAVIIAGVGGYNAEDTMTYTLTGGDINETATASATFIPRTSSGLTGVSTDFFLLGVEGDNVLFQGKSTAGPYSAFQIYDLKDVDITPDDGVTSISLSGIARSGTGTLFDSSVDADITKFKSQFDVSVDFGFDGIVDVTNKRWTFEVNSDDNTDGYTGTGSSAGGADTSTTDTAVVSVSTETSVGNLPVDEINFTLSGDFKFLSEYIATASTTAAAISSDLAGVISYAGSDGAAFKTGTMALNSEMNEVTFTATVTNVVGGINQIDEDHEIKIDLGATPENTLLTTPFTVSVEAVDTTTTKTSTVATGADIGKWTLNGSVVTIPYMPFDDNTAVILRHTNTGSQTGDITIRYMIEGVDSDWQELSAAVATSSKGLMNIRDNVFKDGIIAESGVTSGKVTVEITTNAPSDDITVFAGFKVKDENDRGIVGTFGALGSAQND